MGFGTGGLSRFELPHPNPATSGFSLAMPHVCLCCIWTLFPVATVHFLENSVAREMLLVGILRHWAYRHSSCSRREKTHSAFTRKGP